MVSYGQVEFSMGSVSCFMSTSERQKQRITTSKPWPRMMLESYILPNICPCYFSLRISYGECNGTTHACVNSGYQALLSPIIERLRTRLIFRDMTDMQHMTIQTNDNTTIIKAWVNWGEPERAPHRQVCCKCSIYVYIYIYNISYVVP